MINKENWPAWIRPITWVEGGGQTADRKDKEIRQIKIKHRVLRDDSLELMEEIVARRAATGGRRVGGGREGSGGVRERAVVGVGEALRLSCRRTQEIEHGDGAAE